MRGSRPHCRRSAAPRSAGRRGPAIPFPATQDGAHAQQKLIEMKGLGEIVIATGLESEHAILRIAARGEKQHRRIVALFAQRAAERKTVHLRQHHIEHDELAGVPAQPVEREPCRRPPCPRHSLPRADFRQVPRPDADHPRRRACAPRVVRAAPALGAAGHDSTKRAPCPTPSLCALTRPPVNCIRRRTMKSPSPVP